MGTVLPEQASCVHVGPQQCKVYLRKMNDVLRWRWMLDSPKGLAVDNGLANVPTELETGKGALPKFLRAARGCASPSLWIPTVKTQDFRRATFDSALGRGYSEGGFAPWLRVFPRARTAQIFGVEGGVHATAR